MVTKEQRRRQLAREKFERQQRRRTQQRQNSRVRNSVIAVVLAAVVATGTAFAVGAFDSGKKKDDAADATPSATTPSSATTGPAKGTDPCARPAAGKPGKEQWTKEPARSIDKAATYTFTLRTTCGTIPVTLDAAKAPETVNSFRFLADQGFFDHTTCHRLVTSGIYVLQCGDPTATGNGGPGYTIGDENLAAFGKAGGDGTVTYPAGTVAMANTGSPHSGGSQFFLVYKDSPLQPKYTPFGTIGAQGLKVLDKIAKAGAQPADATTGNTAPNATVVIDKATVTAS